VATRACCYFVRSVVHFFAGGLINVVDGAREPQLISPQPGLADTPMAVSDFVATVLGFSVVGAVR